MTITIVPSTIVITHTHYSVFVCRLHTLCDWLVCWLFPFYFVFCTTNQLYISNQPSTSETSSLSTHSVTLWVYKIHTNAQTYGVNSRVHIALGVELNECLLCVYYLVSFGCWFRDQLAIVCLQAHIYTHLLLLNWPLLVSGSVFSSISIQHTRFIGISIDIVINIVAHPMQEGIFPVKLLPLNCCTCKVYFELLANFKLFSVCLQHNSTIPQK